MFRGQKRQQPLQRSKFSADSQLVEMLVSLGATTLAIWFAMRMLKQAQSPITGSQRAAKKKLCGNLGIQLSDLHLDEYEYAHLSKIVLPQNIPVTLEDVAGSDEILAQLKRDIAFSCSVSPSCSTSLLVGSKGLLLYGPPGTGKTMIASAFAREIQAVLITVRGSTLLSKWVGDSERLTAALFSLAAKLSAAGFITILFVDEVDALLGDNSGVSEHEVTKHMRTEFMQLWDGLLRARRVLVVAATNQPNRLPDSIWRRFSAHFEVPLPATDAREAILQKSIRKLRAELNMVTHGLKGSLLPDFWLDRSFKSTFEGASEDTVSSLSSTSGLRQDLVQSFCTTEMHPIRRAAQLTPRYSGSDLVEICKHAARHCILEHIQRQPKGARGSGCESSRTRTGVARVSPPESSDSAARGKARGALAALSAAWKWSRLGGGAEESSGDDEKFHDPEFEILEDSPPPEVSAEAQLSEDVFLKCVREVKAAANTTRKNYAVSSAGGRGADSQSEGDVKTEEMIKLLMAMMKGGQGN